MRLSFDYIIRGEIEGSISEEFNSDRQALHFLSGYTNSGVEVVIKNVVIR